MNKQSLTYYDISTLCLELSLFLHAGADIAGAFVLLADENEAEDKARAEIFRSIAQGIDDGQTLSTALAASEIVPNDVTAMLKVGEKSGRLEEALTSLADYYSRRAEQDRRVRAALLYPSVLFVVMLTVITVLLAKVLPIFNDVYASLGGEMTGVAEVLLDLGLMLDKFLPVLSIALAAAAVFLAAFAYSDAFREKLTSLWRKNNGKSKLSQKIAASRFAQALSMALSSGLLTEEAVEAAAELLSTDENSKKKCQKCLELLENGENFADALRVTELLPPSECRLLALGMASGSTESAAEEIAERLDSDAEDALERAVGAIELALVVITSLLVGAILLTVMLPLTDIMTAIGR